MTPKYIAQWTDGGDLVLLFLDLDFIVRFKRYTWSVLMPDNLMGFGDERIPAFVRNAINHEMMAVLCE